MFVFDDAKAKKQWPLLTDEDLDRGHGSKLEFVQFVQERYHVTQPEALKQVDAWLSPVSMPKAYARSK